MAKSANTLSKPGTTTGKAADKTMAAMVQATKSGKGTLTYSPGKSKGSKDGKKP